MRPTLPEPPRAVTQAAARLPSASDELIEARLLQHRYDRKYLVHVDLVAGLLEHVAGSHAVLRGGSGPVAAYSTTYYDTRDRRAFHDHRRGRPRRAKVRVRDYCDRGLAMVEVKRRLGNGHTLKLRKERAPGGDGLTAAERAWIASELSWGRSLQPMLKADFWRIGLLGLDTVERSTIDLCVRFSHDGTRRELGPVAVVELKTPRWRQPGRVVSYLHACGPRDHSFSKYCVGSVLVEASLPRARFRPALRSVRRTAAPGGVHA